MRIDDKLAAIGEAGAARTSAAATHLVVGRCVATRRCTDRILAPVLLPASTLGGDHRNDGMALAGHLFLQTHTDVPAVAQLAMAEGRGPRVGVRQTPGAFVKLSKETHGLYGSIEPAP